MTPEKLAELAAIAAAYTKYKDAQRSVRRLGGAAWKSVTDFLASDAVFQAQVERGEFGEAVAALHAADVAALAGADIALRQSFGGGLAIIQAMQNGTPGILFYGVPKDAPPVEPEPEPEP